MFLSFYRLFSVFLFNKQVRSRKFNNCVPDAKRNSSPYMANTKQCVQCPVSRMDGIVNYEMCSSNQIVIFQILASGMKAILESYPSFRETAKWKLYFKFTNRIPVSNCDLKLSSFMKSLTTRHGHFCDFHKRTPIFKITSFKYC